MQSFYQGKNIVITGVSSGIGLEMLRILSKFPCRIIGVDINPLKEQLNYTASFSFIQCDISTQENLNKLIETLKTQLPQIDLFIANAGFAYYEKLQKANWKHIEKIFALNVFSPIYTLLRLKEQNPNCVFCMVVSAMAKMGLAGYSLYCGTKAALDRFAEAFRLENPQFRLITVYPIATRTHFFENAGKAPLYFPSQSATFVAKKILQGIAQRKTRIYPSRIFVFSYLLGFLQEKINFLYQKYAQHIFYQHFQR